jgi:hypothetical protein
MATSCRWGSEIQIADGEVTVAMTQAIHSSSVFNPKAGPNEPERAYGRNPAGLVIAIKNGPTIYQDRHPPSFWNLPRRRYAP